MMMMVRMHFARINTLCEGRMRKTKTTGEKRLSNQTSVAVFHPRWLRNESKSAPLCRLADVYDVYTAVNDLREPTEAESYLRVGDHAALCLITRRHILGKVVTSVCGLRGVAEAAQVRSKHSVR